jgi:hypothetical protein
MQRRYDFEKTIPSTKIPFLESNKQKLKYNHRPGIRYSGTVKINKTMTHYKMTELSEREKKEIKILLYKATKEGGTPLRLVAKKLIMTIYWTHMTLWSYFNESNTVHSLISTILSPRKKETIEETIKREVYGILPWENVGEHPEYYHFIYRRISSETILSKNIHSMRKFEQELKNAIEENKKSTSYFFSSGLGTYALNTIPVTDLPF